MKPDDEGLLHLVCLELTVSTYTRGEPVLQGIFSRPDPQDAMRIEILEQRYRVLLPWLKSKRACGFRILRRPSVREDEEFLGKGGQRRNHEGAYLEGGAELSFCMPVSVP